jgi:hypothetical protein
MSIVPRLVSILALSAPLWSPVAAPGSESDLRQNVAMLRDALPGLDLKAVDAIAQALRGAGFGVTFVSAEQASDAHVLDAKRFFLYVIPNAAVYPAAGGPALMSYLKARGNVLVLGGPAFTRPVWSRQGKWVDAEMVRNLVARVPTAHVAFDFENPAPSWRRSTDSPETKGGFEIVPGGANGTGHAARIWMDRMIGWDNHASPTIPGLFPPGQDLLCFWAKGDEHTTQLLVEANEKDGSRWMAVVPLKPEWAYHVLTPNDFHHWQDGRASGRGGPGDRFHPQAAERLIIGLARSHTQEIGPGPHAFWIDQIGTAANPVGDLSPEPGTGFEPLESVAPSYKTYPLTEIAKLVPAPGQAVLDAGWQAALPASSYSAIVRPAGKGIGQDRRWRWIPLVEARDSSGRRRGTTAWMLLNLTPPFRDAVFGVVGVEDQSALTSDPWKQLIVTLARRMCRGVFLIEAGSRQFAYRPGEKVELGATVRNLGPEPLRATVRFSVTGADGSSRFRDEKPVQVAPGESQTAGASWDPGRSTSDGVVTTELRDGDREIDRIAHSLGFLADPPAKPEDFVTVKDGNFMVHGKPWYPIGINYWSLYVSGLEPDDYGRGWFDPAFYDPDEVELDLERMQALGINMVSIQLDGLKSQRNLLDFLRRCKRHDIRVNGFLGGASPIGFREEQVAEFLKAGDLVSNPVLFAYDTIWEPGNSMFNAAGRRRWDRDWNAWIVEQYGSLANAEADWGMPANRDGGAVVSPTDRQLSSDGRWNVMVAAYRRFMDNVMSRHWNDATTRLRALDPNHLISFRQGNTLPHDFALTATVKHIDFICPEGYSIPSGEDGTNSAGFLTRFVEFTTHGKPIYWAEFGRSIWDPNRMRPDPSAMAGQADYNELFYRVVLDAGAQATAPWWWPGGYRVNERSDFGIMNPDGTPRPAAQLIPRYRERLETPRSHPRPSTWFEFDRDAHAGGYWWTAFHDGAEAYARAKAQGKVLGVRTAGTGTDSSNTPLTAVGNRPYNGKNPPKFLDAEFNRLQVRDRDGRWVDVRNGATIVVAPDAPVRARACHGRARA